MKIAVYCGSFAPVHFGHLKIAKKTIEDHLADCVLFVPTGDYWNKKITIPLNVRIECLKLFEDEKIIVDDDLEDCNAPNTYTLLEQLKIKHPDDELLLLIGADNLEKFDEWVNYQYLLDNYKFIVMKRNNIDVEKEMQRLHKEDYFIIDCKEIDISSTFIREHINDLSTLEDKINKKVFEKVRKYLNN